MTWDVPYESIVDQDWIRHRGPVTSVSASSDLIVSGGYDGAVALANFETGRLELLGHHDHLVNRVAISSRDGLIASASSDYSIGLWSIRTRTLQRRLIGHSDDVEDFCFGPSGIGISASRDYRILVWNLATGEIVAALDGHDRDVLAVNYHRGSVYSSGDDKTLRVWDLDSAREIRRFGPFEDETDSCSVSPSLGLVALGCDSGEIHLFDLESLTHVETLSGHRRAVKRVAFSPNGGSLLSAAYDGQILLWNLTRSPYKKTLLSSVPGIWERSLGWADDGSSVFGGTFDGSVCRWRDNPGASAEITDGAEGNACFNDVATTGEYAIAVSDDGIIRSFSMVNRSFRSAIKPASRVLMNAVAVQSDGMGFAGTHDERVVRFQVDNGGGLSLRNAISLKAGPVNCIRFARGRAFVACYSGEIATIDCNTMDVKAFKMHHGAVKALRVDATRNLGISCAADGSTMLWNLEGVPQGRLHGHLAIVDDVDIHVPSGLAASVSRDFSLRVYDMATGVLAASYHLGKRSPKAVLFWDASTVLVSTYWGEICIVDIEAGTIEKKVVANNGISSLTKTPDGRVIASSYDGALYFFDPRGVEDVEDVRVMAQRVDGPLRLGRKSLQRTS